MVNRTRWALTKAGAKGFASYAGASIPGGSPNARGAESSKTGWLARCLAAVAVASVVLAAVIGTAGTSFRRTRDADGHPPPAAIDSCRLVPSKRRSRTSRGAEATERAHGQSAALRPDGPTVVPWCCGGIHQAGAANGVARVAAEGGRLTRVKTVGKQPVSPPPGQNEVKANVSKLALRTKPAFLKWQ